MENNYLTESMILLSADLYLRLYRMMPDVSYSECAIIIKKAAEEFEEQLDWRGELEERDYLEELRKFEEKKLKEWSQEYCADDIKSIAREKLNLIMDLCDAESILEAVGDELVDDVVETAEVDFNDDDVAISLARVLKKRLGVEE